MKAIGLDELKTLQLDLLQAVDSFCEENGIKYSMSCGTMLGAVRHHGYIPWDDDIDICLLREDYNKLVNLFPKELNDRYVFVSLERDSHWNRAYGKIYDSRTLFYEISKSKDKKPLGINIDVFPIDNVPEDENQWVRYNQKRLSLQHLYSIKYIELKKREWYKNITLIILKGLLLPFSKRVLAKLLDKWGQKYNNIDSSKVFECSQGLHLKHSFNKSIFNNRNKYPFEDRFFMGFANYDDYLKNAYGDYMKLPPVEKQVSHHEFEAFWK